VPLDPVFAVPLWAALPVAFVVTQLANVMTTLYLHRALAHRSVTFRSPFEFVARVVLWIVTGIDRREWVAVHRKHHVFSDEPDDPHSPIQRGVWNVLFLNVVYYRREARRDDTLETYAKDIPADRWDRVLFSRSIVGLGLGVGLLWVLFGPAVAAVAGAVHLVGYIGLSGAVNGFGHWFGRRPHDNLATNLRWLAALTAGEGMHNEHHHAPRSPRFGRTWWDIGGKLAGVLARFGLARLHESGRSGRRETVAA